MKSRASYDLPLESLRFLPRPAVAGRRLRKNIQHREHCLVVFWSIAAVFRGEDVPPIIPRVCVILRGRSVDLSVGVELTAFCVAYVTGHEPPRHPVRDAFRRVPTGGELRSQHETIVRVATGVARIAER